MQNEKNNFVVVSGHYIYISNLFLFVDFIKIFEFKQQNTKRIVESMEDMEIPSIFLKRTLEAKSEQEVNMILNEYFKSKRNNLFKR